MYKYRHLHLNNQLESGVITNKWYQSRAICHNSCCISAHSWHSACQSIARLLHQSANRVAFIACVTIPSNWVCVLQTLIFCVGFYPPGVRFSSLGLLVLNPNFCGLPFGGLRPASLGCDLWVYSLPIWISINPNFWPAPVEYHEVGEYCDFLLWVY